MIVDRSLQFCDGVALNTGAAGVYALGDVVDLNQSGLDIGTGARLYLVVQVSEAATSGGAATARFILASDDNAAIATDGTATKHLSTPEFSVDDMAAGDVLAVLEVPSGTYERYLGLLQTTGTAAFTGGAVKAFLTRNAPIWRAYPEAS